MPVNNRYRSNLRNIAYEKFEEDEVIVTGLLEESQNYEARVAYIKLLGLIKRLKATV